MTRHIGCILAIKEGIGFKYLLLHNPDGSWGFVHGPPKVKEGEEQTAVREIFSQTSKTTDAYDFVPGFKNESLWYEKAGKPRFEPSITKQSSPLANPQQHQATYYLALCRDKEVTLSEYTGYRWLPFDTCLRHLSKPDADLLLKASQFLGSKVVKIKRGALSLF
ncbi:hypothetical protein HY641_04800 [Candidatus Woesearchaeota archaeon]|nr:hypothetical protein [Candidatus Woesearchaeota archaeon]